MEKKLDYQLRKLEQIKKIAKKSNLPIKKIDEIFRSINPEYTSVAKLWKPEQFNDLSQFIYEIGQASEQSLSPVERFQNVLKYFAKGINLSKYQDLLSSFLHQVLLQVLLHHLTQTEAENQT